MKLVVAAHGTRDPEGEQDARAFVDRLQAALPEVDVRVGFVELSEPPMADVMREAAAEPDGGPIVVLPLMLGSGGHAKSDIPDAIAEGMAANPAVEWRYADVLGPDERLVTGLVSRIEATGHHGAADTTVLLVGRGSSDVDSCANVATTARRVMHAGGYASVESAFIAVARPRIEEGLERVARLVDDPATPVVVAPYLLFRGLMVGDVRSRVEAWQSANPGRLTQVRVADVLGHDDALVDLAVQRFRDATAAPASHSGDGPGQRHGHGDGRPLRARASVLADEGEDDSPFVPYPSGLRLAGRRVVIVGGRGVAVRRTEGLLAVGADITVVAPEVLPPLAQRSDAGEIVWEKREFEPADLDGAWYAVACADDEAVDEVVGAAAEERRVFCVRADDGSKATAWTPAVGHLGEVTVAVIANQHPHRARGIRDQIMTELADGIIVAAADGPLRPGVHGQPGATHASDTGRPHTDAHPGGAP